MKLLVVLLSVCWFLAIPAAENALPEVRIPARTAGEAAVIHLDQPVFGEKPGGEPTEVRLAYDEHFLHLSFLCRDAELITAGEKRDDLLHAGDAVEIFIDGTGDHRQFYEIQLNAKGLLRDVNYLFTGEVLELDQNGVYTDWGNVWDDPGFDFSGIRVEAKPTSDGYRIECAIPAQALMRRRGKRILAPGDRLLANFVRLDHAKSGNCIVSCWSPTVAGRPHRSPGRMGVLVLE